MPFYENLSIQHMLEWAKRYPEVYQVLPADKEEIKNLHRQYIANVISTIAYDDFKAFIDKKINERTKKIAEARNMNIKMDPEIYRMYKDSNCISGKYPVPRRLTFLL